MSLKKTSLHQVHLNLNAKMLEFGGFEMPIQYSGIKDEVLSVRENAGVFDVSHMGEFFIDGPQAVDCLDHIMTNDFKSVPVGKAVYSPICRENGTVIDDIIAYKLKEDSVLVCVNAANINKDFEWFLKQTSSFNCTLTNQSEKYSLIALQGPKAESALLKLHILKDMDLSSIPYYGVSSTQSDNKNIILARTGYTGEDGFEIFSDHETIKNIWKLLVDQGVKPCGLAARDVLRLEVCYPLYGHEITDTVTPLDSALKWCVKMNKVNFIGKESLSKINPSFRLVKLSLEKGIPRQGYEVLNSSDEIIGAVTSGTMSVSLNFGIALARIDKNKFPDDKKFFIKVRNKVYNANLHSKPFVSGGHK